MNRNQVGATVLTLVGATLGACVVWMIVTTRQQQQFDLLQHEGMAVILQFEEVRPNEISPHAWREHLGSVSNAWGNVFFAPTSVRQDTLKAALEDLYQLERDAAPETIVERVDEIFDILLRYRPEKAHYINGMRAAYRYDFPQFHTKKPNGTPLPRTEPRSPLPPLSREF